MEGADISDLRLHLSNSSEMECALPNSTSLQSQMASKPYPNSDHRATSSFKFPIDKGGRYSQPQTIEGLHLSNSPEMECALLSSTPLQFQTHSKPDTNSEDVST